MVVLGVGTAIVVLGCLVYYTRTRNAKAEGAARGAAQPVCGPSEQTHPTSIVASTTQRSVSYSASSNGEISQRPSSTPSFSLTSSGDSGETPEARQIQLVQKSPQQNGRPVGPNQPASTSTPSPDHRRLKPPTFSPMPPPPRPTNGTALRPPPSAASMLRVPPTKALSNSSLAPSTLMPPPSKPSRKVILAPGHSPLDWAVLTSNPNHKLRGKHVPDEFIRVPPSILKYHNGRKGRDAWTEYQGKVYNLTPYLPFHPGGPAELMKGAGRDAAKLFMEVHPWVNWDGMLSECLVGILVAEGEEVENVGAGVSKLEEMD